MFWLFYFNFGPIVLKHEPLRQSCMHSWGRMKNCQECPVCKQACSNAWHSFQNADGFMKFSHARHRVDTLGRFSQCWLFAICLVSCIHRSGAKTTLPAPSPQSSANAFLLHLSLNQHPLFSHPFSVSERIGGTVEFYFSPLQLCKANALWIHESLGTRGMEKVFASRNVGFNGICVCMVYFCQVRGIG